MKIRRPYAVSEHIFSHGPFSASLRLVCLLRPGTSCAWKPPEKPLPSEWKGNGPLRVRAALRPEGRFRSPRHRSPPRPSAGTAFRGHCPNVRMRPGQGFALTLSSKTVSRTAPGRTYAPQKRRSRRWGETALFVCGLSSERVIRRCGFCSGWQPSGSSARRVATVARGGGPFRPPDVRGGFRRRREGRSEPSVAG